MVLTGQLDVALVGTPGGQLRSDTKKISLAASGIEIELHPTAVFRPDGTWVEAGGIEPDIEVLPTAEDILGESDSQLDAAVEWVLDGAN